MTEADLILDELSKLRRSTGAGDRARVLRLRRRAIADDGDQGEEVDVEASPGIWESIKNWWKHKSDEEAPEASQQVDEELAKTFLNPTTRPGGNVYGSIQRKRKQLRDIDALFER